MEPLCYVDDLPLPPKDEILRRLNGFGGREAQLEILRLLCPCRNSCRDADVWRSVISLYTTRRHHAGEVREGAHQAVKSLRERARVDTQAATLLQEVEAGPDQRRHEWLWTGSDAQFPKPVRNDAPTIIELLASGDPREREDASARCSGRIGTFPAPSSTRSRARPRVRTRASVGMRARRCV